MLNFSKKIGFLELTHKQKPKPSSVSPLSESETRKSWLHSLPGTTRNPGSSDETD
jgi:hypothetical protein